MSTPDLRDILQAHLAHLAATLRVCLPGRVEAYDAAANTASIQPLLPELVEGVSPDDVPVSHSLPLLTGVPVLLLAAGGVSLTMVPQQGDLVTLLVADRCMDLLFTNGQSNEPGDSRRHDLMDAMALPAFFTAQAVPTDAGTASIGMASTTGAPGLRIHFSASTLALGEANPSFSVALAEKVLSEMQALRATVNALVSAFNAHTHPVVVAGVQVGPGSVATVSSATTSPAAPPAAVNSVASSTVKVKG